MNKEEDKKRFSIIARAKSFTHAWRGVSVFIKSTHNAWIHIFISIIIIFLVFFFGITKIEWITIIIAMGFVLVTESINTAIEIDIDLTSPEFHPYAKDTKDVAAGAVLISTITAIIIGLIVFVPYFIKCFFN